MRSCPDYRAFKFGYVHTFVRSKGKFLRSKTENLCVHVQTIVCSKLSMSRFLCDPNQKSCAPKMIICVFLYRDCPAFKRPYFETLVRSKSPMSGFLCVPNQEFARSKTVIKNSFLILFFFNLFVVLILSFLNSGPTTIQEGLN